MSDTLVVTPDPIMRPKQVADELGITRATLSRWRDAGRFPDALQLGPNSVGWRRSDIDAWLNSRPKA